ncbi:insertion element IS2 transposase InsD [Escherichia coli]|uniref:Insertion element IS2 transposase InsD n=1 Tax=Escherichia coli TaxID=562 RepID=A0A376KY43_ECOLX|nr:insertion element IS2 transposase InsD [Escherichia coli]
MENELLKDAVEYGRAKKVDSARALIARGWGVSLVSRCLRVSRAQLHVILRRTDDWKDGRRSRHSDDADVLLRIHHVIRRAAPHMVIVGYGRCFRRQAELDGMPAINAKRYLPDHAPECAVCLSEKPLYRQSETGHILVKWP